MCRCHSILECCVMFSGGKLSIRSLVYFKTKDKCIRILILQQVTARLDYIDVTGS